MALRLAVMSMRVYWREMASLSCPMMSRATASLTPAFLSILVAVCRKQWKLSLLTSLFAPLPLPVLWWFLSSTSPALTMIFLNWALVGPEVLLLTRLA